jgi:hypothetical protein
MNPGWQHRPAPVLLVMVEYLLTEVERGIAERYRMLVTLV